MLLTPLETRTQRESRSMHAGNNASIRSCVAPTARLAEPLTAPGRGRGESQPPHAVVARDRSRALCGEMETCRAAATRRALWTKLRSRQCFRTRSFHSDASVSHARAQTSAPRPQRASARTNFDARSAARAGAMRLCISAKRRSMLLLSSLRRISKATRRSCTSAFGARSRCPHYGCDLLDAWWISRFRGERPR